MRLKLGQITTVVISSPKAAKEVLQKDRFLSNRTIPEAARASDHSEFGIAWILVSPCWRKLRKICNSLLFSSKVLDTNMGLRQKKVQELLDDVLKSSQAGEAVEIEKAAFKTVLNLLAGTIFSIEYLADHSSETVKDFKDIIWNIAEHVGRPNMADNFPVLRKVDPQGIRRWTTIYFRKIMDFFGHIINQRLELREKTKVYEDNDILDTLISMMISEESKEDDQLDGTTIEHLLLESSSYSFFNWCRYT